MTEWAATTDQVIDNGFGDSREGTPINGAIPHHAAGTDALGYVANWNPRSSHPTYHISATGTVTGIVHPDRQPFSTAHAVDNEAITFEMDNLVAAGDYPIADATIEALIEVILDHYRQSPRFGKGFAKNIPGVTQEEFFIGWHAQYVNTGCPGKYFLDRIDWLVDELNRRASGGTTPTNGEEMTNPLIADKAGVLHFADEHGTEPLATYVSPDMDNGTVVAATNKAFGTYVQLEQWEFDVVTALVSRRNAVVRAAELAAFAQAIKPDIDEADLQAALRAVVGDGLDFELDPDAERRLAEVVNDERDAREKARLLGIPNA